MALVFELRAQYKHFRGALPWLLPTFLSTLKGIMRVNIHYFYTLLIVIPMALDCVFERFTRVSKLRARSIVI